jgi:hypothetical protein
MDLSTKPFRRVIWIVFDGLGYEHVSRCLDVNELPAFSRIASNGHLGPSKPSAPVCQTPPALLSLFCGTQPSENGVWGYRQPDFAGDPVRTVSGFSVIPRGDPPIWQAVDAAGGGSTVLNAAFRNDSVWMGKLTRLDLAYDGYRLWLPPKVVRLVSSLSRVSFRGLDLTLESGRGKTIVRKGSRALARLAAGEGALLDLTRGTSAFIQSIDDGLTVFHPLSIAAIRSSRPGVDRSLALLGLDRFLDTGFFNVLRREAGREGARISLDAEMLSVELGFRRESDLLLWAVENLSSRIFVGYFSLVDYLNHAYMDRLEDEWPSGRAAELLGRCMALVDSLMGRLMALAGEDTLLAVSSDHGSVAYRKMLYVNEIFAGAGLVRRAGGGYQLSRSLAYYHPSDCGQVLVNAKIAKSRGIDTRGITAILRRTLREAERIHGARISVVEGAPGSPYLLFLYPEGDTYFTGQAPKREGVAVSDGRKGGHHLSPFSPTPWIDAVLGLWSKRPDFRAGERAPSENRTMKRHLLDCLGIA